MRGRCAVRRSAAGRSPPGFVVPYCSNARRYSSARPLRFSPSVTTTKCQPCRFVPVGACMAILAASLVFYGWWNPPFLVLLAASIAGNYVAGLYLMGRPSKGFLAATVAFNLGLIGYFKYAGFLTSIANDALGTGWSAGDIALPLAISFFTFQQIAYQVDVYQGKVTDRNFLHYCLFVSFFPQLIAGPIVHHCEVVPQYLKETVFHPRLANLWVGLAIFVIGLYKKVVFADGS